MYRVFWSLVYKIRKWRWKVNFIFSEKKSLMDLWGWKTNYKSVSNEDAHKDFFVYTAFLKKSADKNDFENLDFFYFISNKIKNGKDPFKNEIWTDLLLLAFFFVSYRRLNKKVLWLKKELKIFLNKTSFANLFDNLFQMRFWSFFFSFLFFVIYRAVFLFLLVFFIYFGVIFLVLFYFILQGCSFILKWSFRVVFLSVMFPFFLFCCSLIKIIFKIFGFCWHICKMFWFFCFKTVKQIVNTFVRGLLVLTAICIADILFFCFDLFLFLLYKLFTFLFFFNSVLIHIKAFFIFFVRFVFFGLFQLYKCFCNKFRLFGVHESFFFDFSQEKHQFFDDFKEIFFIFSFLFKFFWFILSFVFFIVCGLGWSLFFFKYSDGGEISRLEPSTRQAYGFLDKWVLFFISGLLSLNLGLKQIIQWWCFIFFEKLLTFFSRVSYYVFFFFIFLKNFLSEVFLKKNQDNDNMFVFVIYEKMRAGIVFIGFCYAVIFKSTFLKNKKNNVYANLSVRYKRYSLLKLLFFRTITVIYTNSLCVSGFKKFVSNCFFSSIFFHSISVEKKRRVLLFLENFKVKDFQELLVFIKMFYSFSTFYWAWVIQISMEIGDLGWWLIYFKKKSPKEGYSYFKTSRYSLLDGNLSQNSIMHSYYVVLNFFLKNITRYKPYIINSFYINNVKNPWKNTFLFGSKTFSFNVVRRFGNWLGVSFVFEILLQRFQHPITGLLFQEKKGYSRWPTNLRFKYFRDFFSEFTWLITHTYTDFYKGLDSFIDQFVSALSEGLENKLYYFQRFRNLWFLSILKHRSKLLTSFFPKFHWNFIRLSLYMLWGACSFVVLVCFFFIFLFFIYLFIQIFFFFSVKLFFKFVVRWFYNLFL